MRRQLLHLMIAMRSLMSLILKPGTLLTFFLSYLSLMNLVQFKAIYINLTKKINPGRERFMSLAILKRFEN